MTLIKVVLTLRIIHIFAAAILVGSVIFNYFFLRPALNLIPPAHAVVVAQRVGTIFTYLGWIALTLLVFSGVLRLYYNEDLGAIFTLELYTTSYGRALGMMILFWFLTVVSSAIMTFFLRPRLMKKLSVTANPSLADVERRRTTQMAASVWVDRLQLIIVFTSTLALIAGASVVHGGLF
ncbi:MAG: hypothetical protein ACE5JU_04305 [Candidatus Binatia bacterium]